MFLLYKMSSFLAFLSARPYSHPKLESWGTYDQGDGLGNQQTSPNLCTSLIAALKESSFAIKEKCFP